MADHTNFVAIWKNVCILLYVCQILKKKYPYMANPLIYALQTVKCKKFSSKLKVQRLETKYFLEKIHRNIACEIDLNASILINEIFAINNGLRNGQWHLVEVMKGPRPYVESQTNEKRYVMIFVSSEIPDGSCFVSPVLFHNLSLERRNQNKNITFNFVSVIYPNDTIKRVIDIWKFSQNLTDKYLENVSSPNYASEVHVQYIESPDYTCNLDMNVLEEYFEIPKLVTVNDILAIPVPSHLGYICAPSNSIIPVKNVFIKVINVEIYSTKEGTENQNVRTALVSVQKSKLYLRGSTRSEVCPLSIGMDDIGDIDVPPNLLFTYNKLKDVIGSVIRSDGNDNYHATKIPCSISILLIGPHGSGTELVIELTAAALNTVVISLDVWMLKGDTSGTTEARLRQCFQKAKSQQPCILLLSNVECLAKDRDGNLDPRVVSALKEEASKLCSNSTSVCLVGTTTNKNNISEDIWSVWSYQESIPEPEFSDRRDLIEWFLSRNEINLSQEEINTVAQRTAGCVFGDFQALLNGAVRCYVERNSKTSEVTNAAYLDIKSPTHLSYDDLQAALDELQLQRSKSLGTPRIPQVSWSEVGGLEEAKREVINTIQLPLKHPHLISSNLRSSGVLLYGPPGTGKTLLAKAVATECGLNFMSVKGPELLNMYVGQSEENVRQVFSKARTAAPCVIFFDELDSLAPNRGRSGDSGGVMDRIVSALLAELDGVSTSADVFVLAATNRPDLLDPALLRPGRFEKLVFLGVCEDHPSQIKILQAITSKMPLDSNLSIEDVAAHLPLTLTGADLYALCTGALYQALHRVIADIKTGNISEDESIILVKEKDFLAAIEQLTPSVTIDELIHYKSLQNIRKLI